MTDKNISNITEKEYLNMADEFKEIMDIKDKSLKSISSKYMNLKKDFARVYGLIRELIEYLDGTTDIEGEPVYEVLSNSIRLIASNNLFGDELEKLGINTEDHIPIINLN
jgi:hypothetical protein